MNDYIQAAFTSLEDIDKKENSNIKKALLESRKKERLKRKESSILRYSGNPEKSIEFFNNSTDIGASSPTTGLGETNNPSSSTSLGEGLDSYNDLTLGDEIEIIEMKDEPSYKGKKGKITFIDDLGQLHGTWGSLAIVPGEDQFKIIEKLNESLPRDLALAYKNLIRDENSNLFKRTRDSQGNLSPAVDMTGKVSQAAMNTRYPHVTIDYEKLQYKKLTKEEALAVPKGERDKLRVVVEIPRYSAWYSYNERYNLIAIFFDKKGNPLIRFNRTDKFEDVINNYKVKSIYYIEDEDKYPNSKRIERDKKYGFPSSYKKAIKNLEELFSELKINIPGDEKTKEELLSEFSRFITEQWYNARYESFEHKALEILKDYLNDDATYFHYRTRSYGQHYSDWPVNYKRYAYTFQKANNQRELKSIDKQLKELQQRLDNLPDDDSEKTREKRKAIEDSINKYKDERNSLYIKASMIKSDLRKRSRDVAFNSSKEYLSTVFSNTLLKYVLVKIYNDFLIMKFREMDAKPLRGNRELTDTLSELESAREKIKKLEEELKALKDKEKDLLTKVNDPDFKKQVEDLKNHNEDILIDIGNSLEEAQKYILQNYPKATINNKVIDESKDLQESIKPMINSTDKDSKIKTKYNLRDEDEIEEAKEKIKNNKEKETSNLIVVHPLNIHKEIKPGDAILQCVNCKETYFINKDELVQAEGEETLEKDKVYNVNYQCDHCGSNEGYRYEGDVSDINSSEAQKVEDAEKIEEQPPYEDQGLEPAEENEEPEEVVEESFDKLINKYASNLYENLKSYKTTSISQIDRNVYLFEGLLTLNNDKTHPIKITLETLENNKSQIVFSGNSELLTGAKNPFRFKGIVKDNKLIFNEMFYNYTENLNGKDYLVEGMVNVDK